MGKYNEELMKAGVLLALDGLHPSSKGARVKFSGKSRTVIDGPFTEAKELITGFSILQVKSLQEAIEWVKRGPNCGPELDERRNSQRTGDHRHLAVYAFSRRTAFGLVASWHNSRTGCINGFVTGHDFSRAAEAASFKGL